MKSIHTKNEHGRFILTHYVCSYCNYSFKKEFTCVEHEKNCKTRLYRIKVEKEKIVPIQVITRQGQKFYRYGDSGKLYKTREQAEEQARAIYASGYKEKKQ